MDNFMNIHQKINAKGNCLKLYYQHDERLIRLIKKGYRHIGMYSPDMLLPKQFFESKY